MKKINWKNVAILTAIGIFGMVLGVFLSGYSFAKKYHPITDVFCSPGNNIVLQFEWKEHTFNYLTVIPCELEE